jgi:hypothetical protein
MKQLFASATGALSISLSLTAATIHIDNRVGTNETVTVSAVTPNQTIVKSIKSGGSTLVNSWFSGITRFEWEIGGSKWSAPLEVRALQTEGTLSIEKDGNYSFKSCLLCGQSSGKAQLISPAPSVPKQQVSPATQAAVAAPSAAPKPVVPPVSTPVIKVEPTPSKPVQVPQSTPIHKTEQPDEKSLVYAPLFDKAEKVIKSDKPSQEDVAEAQAALRTLIKKRSELSKADNDRLSNLNEKMIKKFLGSRNQPTQKVYSDLAAEVKKHLEAGTLTNNLFEGKAPLISGNKELSTLILNRKAQIVGIAEKVEKGWTTPGTEYPANETERQNAGAALWLLNEFGSELTNDERTKLKKARATLRFDGYIEPSLV